MDNHTARRRVHIINNIVKASCGNRRGKYNQHQYHWGQNFFNKNRKTSIFCEYKSSTSFLLTWLSPGRSRKIEYLILLKRTQWRQMRQERPATHFPSWILKMKYDECQDPIFTPSARGRPLLRLHLHQAHPWGPWMFICHCTSAVGDKSCNTSWFFNAT